jgi:hypothetical protein
MLQPVVPKADFIVPNGLYFGIFTSEFRPMGEARVAIGFTFHRSGYATNMGHSVDRNMRDDYDPRAAPWGHQRSGTKWRAATSAIHKADKRR